MRKPVIIGITGASASGKSLLSETIYNELIEDLGADSICIMKEDSYYKDQAHLDMEDRIKANYDHPNAFDHNLLVHHLNELKDGNSVEIPVYDYRIHTRVDKTLSFDARPIILLNRDIKERDRTMESVITQYKSSVRPMFLEFVEPSKQFADIIVPRGGRNRVAIDMIKARIKQMVQ